MSTTASKYIERVDKENSIVGVVSIKKDKNTEEPLPKKTVLGEANQQIKVVE
jgi:hypothetical protein